MILVVGSGFLGSYVLKSFSELTDETLVGTFHTQRSQPNIQRVEWIKLNVADPADIARLADKLKGEKLTVFYFAAVHNIDFIYNHPDEARQINVTALQNFLDSSNNIDKLFFASTDCVYGENINGELLTESSELNPVNIYGIQKHEAEMIVTSHGFTCVRLPFMLGPSLTNKPHFYDTILKSLSEGKSVEMIDGMVRSVLGYRQTARLLYELSLLPREELPPVINIAGDEHLTKYEIGLRLASKIGARQSLIKKISEEEGRKFFKDARASSSAMDNTLLKKLLNKDKIIWEER